MVNMLEDVQLRNVVDRHLVSGEQLLWVSKPSPIRLAAKRWDFALGGVLALALSSFTFYSYFHSRTGMSAKGAFVSTALIAISLYCTAIPVASYFSALATVYAITNKRVLISRGTSRHRAVSLFAHDLARLRCVKRRDGSGDIRFEDVEVRSLELEMRNLSSRRWRPRILIKPIVGFVGIRHVEAVECLLHKTFRKAV
jgi:hypothetical protein